MTKRELLHPEVKRLRDIDGLTFREIGARLGLARSTVDSYYDDPTGEKKRARMARWLRPCDGCGKRMNPQMASIGITRCRACTTGKTDELAERRTPTDQRLPARFRIHTNVEDRGHDTPCWVWAGSRNDTEAEKGYGQYWDEGRMNLAHRYAYALLVGAIPAGLQLDHLCRVRPCVNPAHLEPVTNAENIRRGVIARRLTSKEAK